MAYNEMLDLLYPRRCPVCDDVVTPKGELICLSCMKKLKYIKAPRCQRCGKQLHDDRKEYCYDCEHRKHFFVKGIALYDYQAIKESIYRFKYKDRAEYATFYGKDMAQKLGREVLSWKPDALIPVPLHKKKLQKRTYNQAQLLAENLGKYLGLPVYGDYVQRQRETKPQKELDSTQRPKKSGKGF